MMESAGGALGATASREERARHHCLGGLGLLYHMVKVVLERAQLRIDLRKALVGASLQLLDGRLDEHQVC